MAGPPIRASAAPRPVPSVWASACDPTVIVCMALPLTVPVSSAFLCRSPGVVIPAAVVPPTVPWWTHASCLSLLLLGSCLFCVVCPGHGLTRPPCAWQGHDGHCCARALLARRLCLLEALSGCHTPAWPCCPQNAWPSSWPAPLGQLSHVVTSSEPPQRHGSSPWLQAHLRLRPGPRSCSHCCWVTAAWQALRPSWHALLPSLPALPSFLLASSPVTAMRMCSVFGSTSGFRESC